MINWGLRTLHLWIGTGESQQRGYLGIDHSQTDIPSRKRRIVKKSQRDWGIRRPRSRDITRQIFMRVASSQSAEMLPLGGQFPFDDPGSLHSLAVLVNLHVNIGRFAVKSARLPGDSFARMDWRRVT
jgi:hypothetical protein